MRTIYCLGGSACSGKSTAAEKLAKKYKLKYYGFDDMLWKNVVRGAKDGNEWLQIAETMSMDEMWLSPPDVMCKNAIKTCVELYPYVLQDLNGLPGKAAIIAEGAAFLPYMIEEYGIQPQHYVCMTPSEDFQTIGYSKRLWIDDYLSKTSDKEKAFEHWMKRDRLYAAHVEKEAKKLGLMSIVSDGKKSINETVKIIEEAFGLKK